MRAAPRLFALVAALWPRAIAASATLAQAASAAPTVSACEEKEKERVLYSPPVLRQRFGSPWSVLDAHEHVVNNHDRVDGLEDAGAASNGRLLFLFGGKDRFGVHGRGHLFVPDACECLDRDGGGACDTCDAEERVFGVWYAATPANYTGPRPSPREDLFVVHLADDLFLVAGGVQADRMDLWSYDASERRYAALPSAPFQGRKDMVAASMHDRLFIMGGTDRNSDEIKNDVWYFDSLSAEWALLWQADDDCLASAACPSPREDAAGVAVPSAGVLLLYGGAAVDGSLLGDLWIFSPLNISWTRLELAGDHPPPTEDMVLALDAKRQRVIMHGGSIGEELAPPGVWMLDVGDEPSRWSWTQVPAARALSVKDHAGAVVGDTYVSAFGEMERGDAVRSSIVMLFDLASGRCPNDCVGEGECLPPGVCQCPEGLEGVSCNVLEWTETPINVSPLASAIVLSLALVLVVASTGMGVAFAAFRKRPAVHAASPELNIISCAGCALAGISLALMSLSAPLPGDEDGAKSATSRCLVVSYSLPLAFGLSYGALLAKAKRVAHIFSLQNLLSGSKAVRYPTRWLFAVLGSVVAMEMVLVTVHVVNNPVQFRWEQANANADKIAGTKNSLVPLCAGSGDEGVMMLVIAIANGSVLFYGAYLSYLTRHVRVFLDSRGVGMAISNTLIFALPALLVSSALRKLTPSGALIAAAGGIVPSVVSVMAMALLPPLRSRNLPREELHKLFSLRVATSSTRPGQSANSMHKIQPAPSTTTTALGTAHSEGGPGTLGPETETGEADLATDVTYGVEPEPSTQALEFQLARLEKEVEALRAQLAARRQHDA